jgi:hypothetical protein
MNNRRITVLRRQMARARAQTAHWNNFKTLFDFENDERMAE